MKKITRLLLMTAIAIGMVACSNDDVPPTPESLRGTTYASIAIALPKAPSTRVLPKGPSTRAGLPDDYNKIGTWEGLDTIKTITVFLVNETLGTIDHSTFGTDQFNAIDANGVLKPNLAVKGTPGEAVKAYVVLNGNSDVLTDLKAATPSTFNTVYETAVAKNASDLARKDGTNDVIMMTNTVEPTATTIQPNVKEADAKTGSANTVKVEVERVVSRAIVTVNDGATLTVGVQNANKENKSIITIKDLKYVVGQSNNQFYMIKRDNYVTPDPVYSHVPSTSVTWNPTLFDNAGLADEKRSTVLEATGATAIGDFNTALTTELADSKFVLPVTHLDVNYRKGNTTFFEVIAIFTPNLVDGVAYTEGADVFLGMNDGLFYSTRANAEASGQKATMYKGTGTTVTTKGAIMKYVLWLNPNNIPGATAVKATMSPTVRNQVYHAHIKGFKQIGLPNNPLNPTDPNNPQVDPGDPTKPMDPAHPDYNPNIPGNKNPTNPIKPEDPLQTEDTYLSVEIKVLPWGIHSYEIELGNDY